MTNQTTLFNPNIYEKAPAVTEWELENLDCDDLPRSITTKDQVIEPEDEVKTNPTQNCSITTSNPDEEEVTATVIEHYETVKLSPAVKVGTYYVGGKRGIYYFRLSWKEGSKTKHRHIPGGNIYSSTAQARSFRVIEHLIAGWTPQQVARMIDRREV